MLALPLTASISADPVGVLVAFGAGILSFLSPCVLPLVPGYLSMVTGLSAAELTAAPNSATPVANLRPVLRGIGLFIGGFTVVFVALGAAASGLGQFLHAHLEGLTHLSGIVVVLLGLVLLLGTVPSHVWSHLGGRKLAFLTGVAGERRFDVRPSTLGTWAAPIMGMAFAFAWTPCIGPVLGVVLGLAARNGSLPGGVLLLFAYSLGLGVPFLATGLAFGRLTTVFARARRGLWAVEVLAGVILVAFGVVLLTVHMQWISGQLQSLLNHIGLSRLSTS
jgi:cytochrome c-type biogenesis protein